MPKYSQKTILKKFTQYFDLLENRPTTYDENGNICITYNKQHIEEIKKKLLKGHCFGFSVCHAAMDYVGKLTWWETVLKKIIAWDNSEKALSDLVTIDGKTQSLEKLIERAIHYVLSNQKMFYLFGTKTNLKQRVLLNPVEEESYFQLLIEKNNGNDYKVINQNYKIIGEFSDEDLEKILDENKAQDTICLVTNSYHAIRVGYSNNKWILYNSNYRHNTEKTIYHSFSNKAELIKAIKKTLGNALCITSCTLMSAAEITKTEQSIAFYEFDNFINDKNKVLNFLNGKGLRLVSFYAAHYKNKFTELAKTDNEIEIALTSAISRIHRKTSLQKPDPHQKDATEQTQSDPVLRLL